MFKLSYFTGIATLLNKMNRPEVTVGVDGSLYRFHPHFHDLMEEKIKKLVNPGIKVILYINETFIDGDFIYLNLIVNISKKQRIYFLQKGNTDFQLKLKAVTVCQFKSPLQICTQKNFRYYTKKYKLATF